MGMETSSLNRGFVSYSIEDRIDVTTLSNEEIKKIAENSTGHKYEIILQDLLMAGRSMNNARGCQLELLAVELFVKTSTDVREDFSLLLLRTDSIFKRFVNVLKTSYSQHNLQEIEKPYSSGLSLCQLAIEEGYMKIWSKFVHMNIESTPLTLEFLPYSTENRIDVTTLSNEKIKKIAKDLKSNEKYEIILQDLLIAGQTMDTSRGCQLELLAVELFLEASLDVRTDFLLHLQKVEKICKHFVDALTVIYTRHELEEIERPGGSGLSPIQLEAERIYTKTLNQQVRS